MLFINQLITGEPHIVPSLPQGKYAVRHRILRFLMDLAHDESHLPSLSKENKAVAQRLLHWSHLILVENENPEISWGKSFRIFITEESKPFVCPNETRPDLQTKLSFPTKMVDQRGVAALWTGATVLWSPNNSV